MSEIASSPDDPHPTRTAEHQLIRGLRRELVDVLARGDASAFAQLAPVLAAKLGCSLETIRLLLQPIEHPERTGLPCPDCGAKQERLFMDRAPDGSMTLRLSTRFTADKVNSELTGLGKLFKGWKTP